MAKILLINPNKWGRGITHIWIASHSGILKRNNHTLELFDASFYSKWSLNEVKFQTKNDMYKKTNYDDFLKFNSNNILDDLQNKIDEFLPDFIFWSAISSHIHGEGEYVNIQNGYDLLKDLDTKSAILISGGLQATSATEIILKKMDKINYLIRGESELVLLEALNNFDDQVKLKNNTEDLEKIDGISYIKNKKFYQNKKQKIINDLDKLSPYDYDIFDKQSLIRPYNGSVVKAVDFEMSRGCIYSCNYCVETIIQKYYDFTESSPKTGAIKNFKSYLRHKSAKKIFDELEYLNKVKNVELIRCQDTNFLTNDRNVLSELSDLVDKSNLDIKIYIETRPEGINEVSIELLKKLKVDGVGMGIELADTKFREDNLHRFANQEKTLNAFRLLKINGIKRTAYNIIGLPNQNEDSVLKTIEFNKLLNPDNITVAFYSPYYGTKSQIHGKDAGIFDDYEFDVDSALRTKTKDTDLLPIDKLKFYKENFVKLVRNEI
ncbi:radical SAM protein [Candidatus Pelagibacter sp.]|nr:radical SAM protein [Candidatus Pelagibacter sp.]